MSSKKTPETQVLDLLGQFLSVQLILTRTTPAKEMPKHPAWDAIKPLYTQRGPARVLATVLNGFLTEKKAVVMFSHNQLAELMKEDPNQKHDSLDGSVYNAFLAMAIKSGFLKAHREPSRFGSGARVAGLYELIQASLRAYLEEELGPEAVKEQVERAIEEYDNLPSRSSVPDPSEPSPKPSLKASLSSSQEGECERARDDEVEPEKARDLEDAEDIELEGERVPRPGHAHSMGEAQVSANQGAGGVTPNVLKSDPSSSDSNLRKEGHDATQQDIPSMAPSPLASGRSKRVQDTLAFVFRYGDDYKRDHALTNAIMSLTKDGDLTSEGDLRPAIETAFPMRDYLLASPQDGPRYRQYHEAEVQRLTSLAEKAFRQIKGRPSWIMS